MSAFGLALPPPIRSVFLTALPRPRGHRRDGVWGESGLPVPSVFDALTQMSSLDEDTRRGPINLLEVEGVFLLRGDPRTDLFTERVHESMALSYMIPKETALVMTSFSRLMSGLALSHGFTHVIVDLSSSAMALNGLAVMSSHDVCVAAQPSPLMRWTDRVLIEVFQRWQEKIGPFLENTEMQRWKGDVAGIIMNQASRWPADFTSTVGPNATLVSVPPLRGQIIGSYFDKTRAPLSVLVDRLVGRMTPPE